jgi:hypothetical protein
MPLNLPPNVAFGPRTDPHRRLKGKARNDIAFHTATWHVNLSQIC